ARVDGHTPDRSAPPRRMAPDTLVSLPRGRHGRGPAALLRPTTSPDMFDATPAPGESSSGVTPGHRRQEVVTDDLSNVFRIGGAALDRPSGPLDRPLDRAGARVRGPGG